MERPIEYWRDMYLLHAKSRSFQKKVDEALGVIEERVTPNSLVSWSGGKDSTVLTHLVNSIQPTRSASQIDDTDFPNLEKYVSATAEMKDWRVDVITPPFSVFDLLKEVDFTECDLVKGNPASDIFYELMNGYVKECGIDVQFWGLRNQESKGRFYNWIKRGNFYYNNQTGTNVCNPLFNWSAKDVFAYLFKNDIPIFEVYFKTKFVGSPESIRLDWFVPFEGNRNEQGYNWLKCYYPELYAKLASINPKIRCYV